MLRNLRETIADRIQQNHRMMQECCKGFADNHDAVHADLERQLSSRQLSSRHLSSRNPRRAAVREQTPLNNHAGGLAHYRQSQDASPGSERSFDYNQASFAQALQMLDSDRVSLGNSHISKNYYMRPERPVHQTLRTLRTLTVTLDATSAGRHVRTPFPI